MNPLDVFEVEMLRHDNFEKGVGFIESDNIDNAKAKFVREHPGDDLLKIKQLRWKRI